MRGAEHGFSLIGLTVSGESGSDVDPWYQDFMTCVRPALITDLKTIAEMGLSLWPDGTLDEHTGHFAAILTGQSPSTLPVALFVVELERAVVGFVEVGLRSHADGCDSSKPVGFVEGWFVADAYRGRGLGGALILAAEDWSGAHGCQEIASDTWFDNESSQLAHIALGFEIVDRCVTFRKRLGGLAIPKRRN